MHSSGSYIYCQIIALGRGAAPGVLEEEDVGEIVSSSAIPNPLYPDGPAPRALSGEEIQEYIRDFASAAKNAVEAGFDGVEVDAANGMLIDQFTQDTCNKRTDEWGGSIPNRSRFALEVTRAVARGIGADRTGIRLSPWSRYQGMRMADPMPQFLHLIEALRGLDLAYLHLINPRILGDGDAEGSGDHVGPLLDTWGTTSPILLAGGYDPASAKSAVDEEHAQLNMAVVFGRYFVSNPDLVWRVKNGVLLRAYDRSVFYKVKSPVGYADYEFCDEWKTQHAG